MVSRFRSLSFVLMYHRIAAAKRDPWSLCVTPQHFSEHLEVLKKYNVARLDELCPGGWSIGGKSTVAITFDDGYADNLHAALPLLQRYETPATFFITTGYIDCDGEFWWDELERIVYAQDPPAGFSADDWHLNVYRKLQPLSHWVRRKALDQMLRNCAHQPAARAANRILTSHELAALASEPLAEIGAHTVTHPLLAAHDVGEQLAELRASKQWLEKFLGREVASLSYPYGGSGHYTAETIRAARDCGFRRACTTDARCIGKSDPPLAWGRAQVPDVDGDRFEEFLWSIER